MNAMTWSELVGHCNAILPHIVIAATICAVVLADLLVSLRASRRVCGGIALGGTILALLLLIARFAPSSATGASFRGMFVHDQAGTVFNAILLLGAAGAILFSMRSRELEGFRHGEYFSLLLGGLMGAMFLVTADNFILFVIGMETLSIGSYVLAGSAKHNRLSAEASLKYLVYGAVASGVMLFGISYWYGMTGTLTIGAGGAELARMASGGFANRLGVLLVLALILAGVGFKCAMVPFHFWCPDVYQGAPTPITAFLAVVSKTAGFGALVRLMLPFFTMGGAAGTLNAAALPIMFGILSVVTMTYGNLAAIRQTDVKRLLAYSSIAHAGYLLLGMTVYRADSIEAMLFYLFVYLFMNLGAFWVAIVVINRAGRSDIAAFRGMATRSPVLATAMFIFLIALTGLPPTAGFVGKFMIFKVVIGAGLGHMTEAGVITPMAMFYFTIALIGVLNSAISLYYYMTIIRAMAFDAPDGGVLVEESGWDRVYAVGLAVPTVVLLHFAPILAIIRLAAGG
ncbi:MAG: NADH-quinone oxidoreductase subunit N [Candidatus Hydrogenedentes bacterium]|nr:NADH-quinone oxidoreductase subunit N [Candidatus Hydrogenedentota bacterium]